MSISSFVAGFVGGWVARSTVDSSRGMVVALVAAYLDVVERVKRVVVIEREHLADLVAEGRSKLERDRAHARTTRQNAPASAADAPSQERIGAGERAA
jgi:hypothetical protein